MTIEFRRCGQPHGELGTCYLPDNGHTRHRARTEFGEMEWTEGVPIVPEEPITFVGTEAANARIEQLRRRLPAEDDETSTAHRLRLVLRTMRAERREVSRKNRILRTNVEEAQHYITGLVSDNTGLTNALDEARRKHSALIDELDSIVANWRGTYDSTTDVVNRLAELVRDETQPAEPGSPPTCGATCRRMFELDYVTCVCSLPPGHEGMHNDSGTMWVSDYGIPPNTSPDPFFRPLVTTDDDSDEESDHTTRHMIRERPAKKTNQENLTRLLADLADQLSSTSVALAHIRQLHAFGPPQKQVPSGSELLSDAAASVSPAVLRARAAWHREQGHLLLDLRSTVRASHFKVAQYLDALANEL